MRPARGRCWLDSPEYSPKTIRPARHQNICFACRAASSNSRASMSDQQDYRETVFLPKTEFPMKAGLAQKEPAILAAHRGEQEIRSATGGVGVLGFTEYLRRLGEAAHHQGVPGRQNFLISARPDALAACFE